MRRIGAITTTFPRKAAVHRALPIRSSPNVWVKHGDKVCSDSGSDAWRGMVAAGAIAGEGAAPVERLENLDVLRKVKKLWGPMDDYFMQAHGGLFLLSGAIDDLPEEEFPEHFGMTKQDFEDEYGD